APVTVPLHGAKSWQLHARDGGDDTRAPELAAHLDVEQEVRVDVAAVLELELRLAADQVVAERIALEHVDLILVRLELRGARLHLRVLGAERAPGDVAGHYQSGEVLVVSELLQGEGVDAQQPERGQDLPDAGYGIDRHRRQRHGDDDRVEQADV